MLEVSRKSLPLRPLQPKSVQAQWALIQVRPGFNHSQSLMASNFAALWPTDSNSSVLKRLAAGFTLSKWPHLQKVYWVNICNVLSASVSPCESIIKLWLPIINSLSTYKARGVIVDASSGIPKSCECKNRKINAAKVWKHQRFYANFRTRFVYAWRINNKKLPTDNI